MSELLLTNGTIRTLNRAVPIAASVLIKNGRIEGFDDEAVSGRTAKTEVLDLRGRTVIPGLIDSHIHFTGYAIGLARVQLSGARTLEEAVSRVAAKVRNVKTGEWILGQGWNHMDWDAPVFPNKSPLDQVAPENPVALERKDGHSLWVNSLALKLANITRDTRDPQGGVITRDDSGEPTGLLQEKAAWQVEECIGEAAQSLTPDELLKAIHSAHQAGLVGIHNVEGPNSLRMFEDLALSDRLRLRVLHMIPADNLEHAIALGIRTGLGNEWLKIGGVKIFADGSLGSQTAHMLAPYEGQSGNTGVAVTAPSEIERLALTASRAGIMVVTHAIGDRAIRDVLDVYEKVRAEDRSTVLRIEHVQHLNPADLPRFARLNVIASMQPIHATSDYAMADRLIGSRARYTYAFKSLLTAGARLVFGSDCPVETLDPLAGIYAAVTRETANGEPRGGWYPQEKLTVDEAVRGYASPLEIGSWADCLVLSQDIFQVPAREILHTRVTATMVGGQIVYEA